MPHLKPFCRFEHPRGVHPQVLALRITDRVNELRVGGVKLRPRVTHGVEIHCSECHGEGWIALASGWRPDSWDGPATCSCGETGTGSL